MGKARRTTHRSSKGKKLYAVRDASGRFKDIQTYERSHRADLARSSKAETKANARKKTGARKKAGRRKAAKKR
jgi:DNA-binding protein HU-beta